MTPQVRKRFKSALRRAKVREVRFHDLRHTFGTRMAGVGVPMRTLQEWMGHRNFKTTLIYADYSPSEREREWVEVAFARPTEDRSETSQTWRAGSERSTREERDYLAGPAGVSQT
jgi:hypothetical protein